MCLSLPCGVKITLTPITQPQVPRRPELISLAHAICSWGLRRHDLPATPQDVPIFRLDDADHEHDMFDAPEERPSFVHVVVKSHEPRGAVRFDTPTLSRWLGTCTLTTLID